MRTTISEHWLATSLIIFATLVYSIRAVLIRRKRPERRAEMIRLIDEICEPVGNTYARKLYDRCYKIRERYGITLKSCGYAGDMSDLKLDADNSEARAHRRGKLTCSANQMLQ